jgi:hypothetical protein
MMMGDYGSGNHRIETIETQIIERPRRRIVSCRRAVAHGVPEIVPV